MPRAFKIGDHVTWNSEAGQVSGHIVQVPTRDLNYKGYTHPASEEDPQYEIKMDGRFTQPSLFRMPVQMRDARTN